jgi:hypothetical protein
MRVLESRPYFSLALIFALTLGACEDLVRRETTAPTTPPELPELPPDPGLPEPAEPAEPAEPDLFAPVMIDGLTPDEGPVAGGLDIMVTGTGFREGLEILFEETPSPEVFIISPNVAIARLPPHPAGRVDVTLTHPFAPEPSTLPAAFRFFETISVTAITPSTGPRDGGDTVTITGKGFTPDTIAYLDGRPLREGRVIDPETIRGFAPPGPFGRVDLHAVGFNGTASLEDAYRYLSPPTLSHILPVAGYPGLPVTLHGEALGETSSVFFGDSPATLTRVAPNGRHLEVLAPPGQGVVPIRVQTDAGLTILERAFAYATSAPPNACIHAAPDRGPASGGTQVALACPPLSAPVTIFFGTSPATLLEQRDGMLLVLTPPGAGRVPITIQTTSTLSAGYFDFQDNSPLAITSIAPTSGPLSGGTRIILSGRGLTPQTLVHVGGLPATSPEMSDESLTVLTPPGLPGRADVVVRASGVEARLEGAFDYLSDRLAIALVTPSRVARSGGTLLRVHGEGFDDTTTVLIGDTPASILARPSSAELLVKSPRLELGPHDATVKTSSREARLANAIISYDPRSGTGGTWGAPIDGALNVTVWGSNGYGPIEGAFVTLGTDAPLYGFTDDEGQLTLSASDLYGPIEVHASAAGFTAYSVVAFDAENVTVILQQNPPPTSGGGSNDPPPPNATISGTVSGLDKYVVAPPGSCAAKAIPDTLHCSPCEPTLGCGDNFACTELPTDIGTENVCVQDCDTPCPDGYRCGATMSGARCLPSPGEKRAYCNISSPSLFGYEYALQPGSWVDEDQRFTLDSQRLGEIAIYCFGGYEDDLGVFTPTVLGVARNIFAVTADIIDDLKIELSIPLERSFRFRMVDLPTSSTGLEPPDVVISLNLGSDGVIPFSRDLVEVAPDLWVAPRQLTSLSGPLYDTHYLLYTTITPAGVTGPQPRSFHLVQQVDTLSEDRVPVFDGRWRLDSLTTEADLHGLWRAPDDNALWAVGDNGLILRRTDSNWTRQSSPTQNDLMAISGTFARDIWAAGRSGTLLRWDGLGWFPVDAPVDDYVALHITPTHVYAAGQIRLRVLDRLTGLWSVAGAPLVQQVSAFVPYSADTLLALGSEGRIFVHRNGAWTALDTPAEHTLRAGLVLPDGTLVVVGDHGTVLAGPTPETLVLIPPITDADLTALTTHDGDLVIVGDRGIALLGPTPDSLEIQNIPGYRSRASAIASLPNGDLHVVGSTAFILGPFLDFPTILAPGQDATLDSLDFEWTWNGVDAQYTRLAITPEASMTAWTVIIDGLKHTASLPDLSTISGLAPLGSGRHRLDILRVLNENFDIDGYSSREFSMYARESWSTQEAWFFIAPPR